MFISCQQLSVQRLYNILVLGTCGRKDGIIIYIHVGFCNISCYNQSFQLIFPHHRKRNNPEDLHHLPCLFHRDMTVYSLCTAYLNILDLCSDIRNHCRGLCMKPFQNIRRLRIYRSGSLCNIGHSRSCFGILFFYFIFQVCIRNRCTYGVCIRMLMSYNPNFLFCHIRFSYSHFSFRIVLSLF